MVFGHFIEHFHRQIYGGIYEPGSPLSDERGFRLDVIEAMRELRAPVVRWPGGCFVSAYHWLAGAGPRRRSPVGCFVSAYRGLDGVGRERRAAYDEAWRVEDPNSFGTAEFVAWCRAV